MTEASSNIVLVAVDESDYATKALEWYVRSVHKPEYKVVIISVVEVTHVTLVGAYPAVMPETVPWQEQFEKKKKHMEKFLTQKLQQSPFKEVTLPIEIRIRECPRPGEVIVEEAEKLRAQLVVMGTRGLGTLRRTILGSVSDYVVHHAHCPVLVCRDENV